MTVFVSKQYGRQVLGAVPDLWPDLCLALLTDEPPVDAGTVSVSGVEVSGINYERVSIPVSAWADPVGNAPASMLLDEDVVFPEAGDGWPDVKWIALMPDATGTDALIAKFVS